MSDTSEAKRIAADLIVKAVEEYNHESVELEALYGNCDIEIDERFETARLEITWADDSQKEFEAHLLHLLQQREVDLAATGMTEGEARSSVNLSGNSVVLEGRALVAGSSPAPTW